jgi:hypothetical protein
MLARDLVPGHGAGVVAGHAPRAGHDERRAGARRVAVGGGDADGLGGVGHGGVDVARVEVGHGEPRRGQRVQLGVLRARGELVGAAELVARAGGERLAVVDQAVHQRHPGRQHRVAQALALRAQAGKREAGLGELAVARQRGGAARLQALALEHAFGLRDLRVEPFDQAGELEQVGSCAGVRVGAGISR